MYDTVTTFPDLTSHQLPGSTTSAEMAGNNRKRGSNNEGLDPKSIKKNKTKEYWKNQAKAKYHSLHSIEEGSQGIFATCDRGREARCVEEMYRLLEQVASELYGLDVSDDKNGKDEDEDIEASIRKEIGDLKGAKSEKPFVSVKLDVECVVFFCLKPPCEPTAMVNALCAGTVEDRLKSRYVHRLTPVTRIGKANAEGLEAVAKEVLPPHFHQGEECIKFAIKPTSRNHNYLKRDQIIKIVADVVGTKHKADLKNPDLLILVDFYQSICGMSVVKDWETLKKFNLAQLQEPKTDTKEGGSEGVAAVASGVTRTATTVSSSVTPAVDVPAEKS
ncbi:hypothetical protein C7212DRAFT_302648 [Tuber magnatum]|uniref:THUMP domain-containing protein n=1 Tax=Tuber magnatum TaxID=42249 RepID=A0A317SET8_9PEZI|nr:hypothetical protein C7212DRAFT_302648 [Tuber magnatum]